MRRVTGVVKDVGLRTVTGVRNMDKATKVFTVALALALFGMASANGAGLSEEMTKSGRSNHTATKSARAPAWQRGAKSEAMLGFKYEHGLGVPQSYVVAADLYKRAAEQGDPTGQYLLGLMYDKGHGVWPDGVQAYKWLNLAAAHAPPRNRENYLRFRDVVAAKLTPAQLYQAQWLAYEWTPSSPQW